jgi:hypothetical protein
VSIEIATSEPLVLRIALVLGALAAFVLASDLTTGAPPAFLTTVMFGAGLGLALEAQAQLAARTGDGDRAF